MSPSFEDNGKKYLVSGMVHGNQGSVAHVETESPFTSPFTIVHLPGNNDA